MWNEPVEKELRRLPRLYSTDDVPLHEKVIHMHFFLGGCDWYVAEYGPEERIFFNYAILNSDFQNAEWGYTSFDELRELRTRQGFEVDRELYWRPKRAIEIDKIQRRE